MKISFVNFGIEVNGSIVKRYGDSDYNGYYHDNGYMRKYGASEANGWEYDGSYLKPFGQSDRKYLEVSGNVPTSILCAILFELLEV